MPNVTTERLYALVSATVSAQDGIVNAVMTSPQSAFLGTMGEFILKLMNRITTASTTLISGGSAGSVAVGTSGMGGASGISGIAGVVHGWPWYLNGEARSGQPTSLISTASTTIRKVVVGLTFSAFPIASSFDMTQSGVAFVYGSAFATSAGAVTSGGQSAYFNSVPLPKWSAGFVPVGILNVPNSFSVSANISTNMMITDYRATQGFDLSAFLQTPVQP